MHAHAGLEKCLTFISSQLPGTDSGWSAAEPGSMRQAVTISRQAGCGALEVAEKLARYLQEHSPKDAARWTVFDRNLVEKVLEDHNLPQRLRRFMPENRISEIEDTIDELFGLHPSSWLLVRQTAETILRLTMLGNVILIGRAANVITSQLENVFHVRLVASLEKRAARIQHNDRLDPKAALDFIRREDRGRKRYLRKYYHRDISDLLLYHLVINTDLVPCEKAARIVGDAVLDGPRSGRNRRQSGIP
jgi:cytidylate kinase